MHQDDIFLFLKIIFDINVSKRSKNILILSKNIKIKNFKNIN